MALHHCAWRQKLELLTTTLCSTSLQKHYNWVKSFTGNKITWSDNVKYNEKIKNKKEMLQNARANKQTNKTQPNKSRRAVWVWSRLSMEACWGSSFTRNTTPGSAKRNWMMACLYFPISASTVLQYIQLQLRVKEELQQKEGWKQKVRWLIFTATPLGLSCNAGPDIKWLSLDYQDREGE